LRLLTALKSLILRPLWAVRGGAVRGGAVRVGAVRVGAVRGTGL